MRSKFLSYDQSHPRGENATRPIEPPWGALAALLLLAGNSLRRRRALPSHPMTAHSGASNCGFQVETRLVYSSLLAAGGGVAAQDETRLSAAEVRAQVENLDGLTVSHRL